MSKYNHYGLNWSENEAEKKEQKRAYEWLKKHAILESSPLPTGIMVKGNECVFFPHKFEWLQKHLTEKFDDGSGRYYFNFKLHEKKTPE